MYLNASQDIENAIMTLHFWIVATGSFLSAGGFTFAI
jgi:hypothetical protein